jgi:hypothetical protein
MNPMKISHFAPAILLMLGACGDDKAIEKPGMEAAGSGGAGLTTAKPDNDCDPYLKFCVKASVSGVVSASGVSGFGGGLSCAEWVRGGAPRVLDLPTMLPMADKNTITAALTNIGQYTGPGEYTLVAARFKGLPDAFPAIDTGERSFAGGEGSTAIVRIAADGSGQIEAKNLVEIKAAHRMTEPDPAARVNFSMRWTCRDL